MSNNALIICADSHTLFLCESYYSFLTGKENSIPLARASFIIEAAQCRRWQAGPLMMVSAHCQMRAGWPPCSPVSQANSAARDSRTKLPNAYPPPCLFIHLPSCGCTQCFSKEEGERLEAGVLLGWEGNGAGGMPSPANADCSSEQSDRKHSSAYQQLDFHLPHW